MTKQQKEKPKRGQPPKPMPDVPEVEVKPSNYQPSKAEMEADVSIPTTPDALLEAVMNYKPRKES